MSGPEPPSKAGSPGIGAIHDALPIPADPAASAAALAERDDLQNARLRKENELLETEVEDRRQDRRERLKYAERIFWLIVCWLVWMGGVVGAQGFRWLGFDLAGSIVIALVGGTTATVIGVFLIVANYLFPRDPRKQP